MNYFVNDYNIMTIIKVKNKTIVRLSIHLSNKYPFLASNQMFKSQLLLLIRKTKIINSADYLVTIVNDKQNYNNIGEILDAAIYLPSTAIEKSWINKYQIYCKYDLQDFPVIQYAVDFYGKTINELAADAMLMFNYKSPNIAKIKNQILCDQIEHLIKCDILIVLGILFYYLKIATIIENIYPHNHKFFCNIIVNMILHNEPFDYEKIKSGLLSAHIKKLENKIGSKPEYYDNFVIGRIKQIYDMFCDPIFKMQKDIIPQNTSANNKKSLCNMNFRAYLKQFPESSIVMNYFFEQGQDLFRNYYFLIPIYHQFGNTIEPPSVQLNICDKKIIEI